MNKNYRDVRDFEELNSVALGFVVGVYQSLLNDVFNKRQTEVCNWRILNDDAMNKYICLILETLCYWVRGALVPVALKGKLCSWLTLVIYGGVDFQLLWLATMSRMS